jgi:hypothetical protein
MRGNRCQEKGKILGFRSEQVVRLAIIIPILLLVMMSSTTAVWATNEVSYKFGFNLGVDDYKHCFDTPQDADDCSPPDSSNPLAICVGNPNNQAVTNSTACIDGYVQGWQHWCKSDTKDCVDFMLSGHFPGALIYGKNVYHGTDGNYIKLTGIPAIPPRPSTVPSLEGTCPPGMYLDRTLGIYHCHAPGRIHEPTPANMTNQWQKAW